ncbi:MAG: hypothetical protein AB7F19_05790 [Candidatus Babeliales bacterium]
MLSFKQYSALILLGSVITHTKSMDQDNKKLSTSFAAQIAAKVTQRKEAQEALAIKSLEEQWLTEVRSHTFTPMALADRILGCTKRIQEQTTILGPLLAQEATLTAERQRHTAALLALATKTDPLTARMKALQQEQTALVTEGFKCKGKKIAAARVHEAIVEFAMHEPALANLSREELEPPLVAKVAAERTKRAQEAQEKKEALAKLNGEISPFIKDQEALQTADAQTKDSLSELQQQMQEVTKTRSLIEREKEILIAELDARRTAKEREKQTLTDEAAAIRATIPEEKDSKIKIDLRTQLLQKERDITTLQNAIEEMDQALARAKGIQAARGWFK